MIGILIGTENSVEISAVVPRKPFLLLKRKNLDFPNYYRHFLKMFSFNLKNSTHFFSVTNVVYDLNVNRNRKRSWSMCMRLTVTILT